VSKGNLTEIQERILAVLADVQPRWTLTGGGAIVGFYLPHRNTKDLDLFWRGQLRLEGSPDRCAELLSAAGMRIELVQTSTNFVRWRVSLGEQNTIVDLVADPGPSVYEPKLEQVGGRSIQIDSLEEILVNKLVAVLSRFEIRDLADIQVLLERGLDLRTALDAAPQKDGGFSPMTLAWLLQSFPMNRLAERSEFSPEQLAQLETFRSSLAARLIDLSNPGDKVFERP
jgi:hypothetical protein